MDIVTSVFQSSFRSTSVPCKVEGSYPLVKARELLQMHLE